MSTIERATLLLMPATFILSSSLALADNEQLSVEDELLDMYGDVDMISIATGNLQSIAKAPAVASVIYAKDIEAMGATDLDQVLETIPGLHVRRSSLAYNPIYIFRGIDSDYNPQVLMLINGIPISNLFHGDRSLVWGGMPVRAIERVEVIRGPGSALYGADAFAGVINIVTLSGEDITQNQIGASTGSYNTKDAWLKLGSEWQGFDMGLVVEYHQTDGQDEIISSDLQTGLDFFTGTQASHAPGPLSLSRKNLDIRLDIVNGHWRLRTGLQQRKDVGNGAGIAEALDPENRWSSERFNVDLTYHNSQFTQYWDMQAQISYFDTSIEGENNMRIFPAGADLGIIGFGGVYPDGLIGNPDSFERHYRGNLSANYSGFEYHQIRTGIGYVLNDLYKVRERKNFGPDPLTGELLPPGADLVDVSDTPFVFLREGDRENSYLFIQDVWNFTNDWELTAGLRYDNYSDFGSTANPRFALVWSTTRKLTSKLLYGKAFRAPSFAETNAINNPVVLGNPDLDPEKLSSYELAFDYRLNEQVNLNLNLFHYDWQDVIKFTTDPGSNSKSAKNVGRQSGKGVEFEASWRVSNSLQFNINYAWQDSQDKLRDHEASLAPKHQFYLSSDWELNDNLKLNGQLNWVMDRARQAEDLRPDIKGYAMVDVALHYKPDQGNWGIDLMIRNLTDTDAREPSVWSSPSAALPNDLPLAGRNAYAQLYVKF